MRNLRKFVALVLAFAMVLSMSAVSFAADMTAAEKAEALGVLQGEGDGVTAEYLAKTPTRLQAAIISLRLRGLEDEAKAYEGTEVFADHEDITWDEGKNIASYLKANPDLGWIGAGDDMLKPNEPISAQAYVKVMLEALGYKQGTDFTWEEVFTFAATKGLDDLNADTVMTNDHLAVGSVEALDATTSTGTKLVDDLVEAGVFTEAEVIAVGLKEEAAADFAIVSTEPYGLNAVMITFASDIDGDVTVTSDDIDIEDVVEDGAVAIVVLDGVDDANDVAEQTEELELTVTATGVDGIEVDEEDVTVTMIDKADPELVSVTVENPKTIVVKYSEPIDPASLELGTKVFADVKIDDAKAVGKATQSTDLTEITYVLNDKLAANSYVFTMEGVEDFAGFVAPSFEQTITVVADDSAPQLVSAEATSKTEVVLTFDEDVESIGTITIDGADYTGADVDIDGAEVTVTIAALEASDAFVNVSGEYDEVEDVVGNKSGDDVEFSFKAPLDEDAPTVAISVTEDNYLVFDFSEEVEGFTIADVELQDEDGDVVDSELGAAVIEDETVSDDYDDADDTIYLIAFDTPEMAATEYTVILDGEVKDLSVLGNEVAETTVAITTNDLERPTVSGNATLVDTEVVRISFSEEMDSSTLSDISNYLFSDGGASYVPLKTFDDEAEFDVAADGKSVDITIDGMVVNDDLKLLSLEDVAGNLLAVADYNVEKNITAPAAFTVVSFTQTGADTIEVVASEEFSVVDPNEFTLMEGGSTSPTHYFTSAVIDEDDATKAVLTLNDDLLPDTTTDNATVVTIDVDGDDTVDIFGTSITDAAAVAVGDEVSATASVEGAEAAEAIEITFDEVLAGTTTTDVVNDVIIRDTDNDVIAFVIGDVTIDHAFDVDADDPANNFVTKITIAIAVTEDTDYTVEIFARYLEDADANTINALPAEEVTVENQ